ncbi:outer membrane protein assembly factor BamB [Aestuariibacter sp. AA17]|uniref:Outer membrane protein assembly factor BamB n=1 Tax=Fluctibacter corallii TaxID=2984329 RepID=A0ABT3A369_9ALTE|nr:outer membrane protein assembly factor BamB [Aestuariibacter sp. AA17]MCV2883125.1 outer membrane protein assembly factor BamB [Aestuariibacter sp. AA17]
MANLFTRAKRATILSVCMGLTACSTVSGWFNDDEDVEIRELAPITAQFEPQVQWAENVGNGVDHYFSRLRPAVAYNKVFAASRHGVVKAFDKHTGETLWRKSFAQKSNDGYFSWLSGLWDGGISAKISGGMTVAYDTLFFGTENGEVFALDASTGELKWKQSVAGEVIAEPAVDEGVVVVNTGSGMLVALDASSGEQLWQYESDVPALSLRGISSPTISNGGAIVGTASGKLAVNIIDSGQTVWEQAVAKPSGATELDRIADIDSRPLVVNGVVFVISYEGTLAAVELRSGRVIWNREYKSYRRLTLAGNQLFVVDLNSNIYGLDRRNGVELWSQRGLKGRTLTGAEPVGDYIVLGDKFGFLHWLSQESGDIVARLDVGGDDEDESIFAEPVADENTVYTMTRSGEVVSIKMP